MKRIFGKLKKIIPKKQGNCNNQVRWASGWHDCHVAHLFAHHFLPEPCRVATLRPLPFNIYEQVINMRNIIIISATQNYLKKASHLLSSNYSLFKVFFDEETLTLFVEMGDEHVTIELSQDMGSHYDEFEKQIFLPQMPTPHYFLVSFRNIELLKIILVVIADTPDVFIDDDDSHILRGDRFIALCKKTPGWDWVYSDLYKERLLQKYECFC